MIKLTHWKHNCLMHLLLSSNELTDKDLANSCKINNDSQASFK